MACDGVSLSIHFLLDERNCLTGHEYPWITCCLALKPMRFSECWAEEIVLV